MRTTTTLAALAAALALAGCGSAAGGILAASTPTRLAPVSCAPPDDCATAAASQPAPQWTSTYQPQGGQSQSPSAAPAPTMTRQTDTLVFKVWGSGYPTIQYGSKQRQQ